jgi:3-oxoacyl-[acyl-carrier-protein] synthase II
LTRVAVTGVGIVSALGLDTGRTWSRLMRGESAVGPIKSFDATSLCSQIGAEIADFRPEDFSIRPRTLRLMTRADQLAFGAATLAIRDAGWNLDEVGPDRGAVYAGGNKEICNPDHLKEACLATRGADGRVDEARFGSIATDSVYPLFYVEGLPGATLFFISEAYGMKGPNAYFAGTAEAGLTAIGAAFRAVRRGQADVALAGGFDDAVNWWNFTKLDAIGILSDQNDLGSSACKPYDRERTGSVLGDGAAFLALEDLGRAQKRGAVIYAELTGFGAAFDSHGMISPDPTGSEVTGALRAALKDAKIGADQIDYIASHGSATHIGDVSEARGIRGALGAHADRVVASAVKAATGHMVAGAGALNAAVACLAVRNGEIPPTLNLHHPDPECDLDWTPNEGRRMRIGNVVAIARGIEGQGAALVARAV